MERKPYKNSVENKSRIIFSLAEIMANKPFHAVSVTEVCKKAGVSKNTFY
ncbi:MAG: TetR/AcrR family transcriptional regulator, partial [Oscillospiraceae bacterium]|nr:TetR/AcrR family transcriptional regulator [Oscillospiraceae bacterium]